MGRSVLEKKLVRVTVTKPITPVTISYTSMAWNATEPIIGMIASCYFIGFMIGSLVFPCLSYRYGRKPFELLGLLA